MESINKFTERFNQIDDLFANSKIYKESEKSFNDGLKKYSINEQEKALSYADYKAKTLSSLLSMATEAALRVGLAYEQEVSETTKREAEVSIMEENVLKLKIDQNIGLNTLNLGKQQAINEALRKADIQASIEIKEKQLLGAHIANISENEKRKVLIKSANDNAIIKKGEHLNNYMKVLSDDASFTLNSAGIHEKVKENILEIGKNTLECDNITIPEFTPLDINLDAIENEASTPEPVFRIIVQRDIRKDELVSIYCMSVGLTQPTFEWNIESQIYSTQKIRHAFSAIGKKEIVCTITNGDKTYIQKETIYVK